MIKIGTLAEIGAKPGDVVEWPGIAEYLVLNGGGVVSKVSGVMLNDGIDYPGNRFRIVSRAEATPKLWRDMTPEEKGALLLAHHEGKVIECMVNGGMTWRKSDCSWYGNHAYRIKPEPKVEIVTLYGSPVKHIQWCLEQCAIDTHRITFNLIDGEPDCTSIKMEKLQ